MKDDYTRTTRRVNVGEIVAPLRDALVAAARTAGIEDLDASASLLLETHSVKTRAAGFFARILSGDADREHWSVLAITQSTAFVATWGAARGTWVRALPLETLELQSMPALAGEMAARTIVLASPVLASLGPNGEPMRVGSFALILGTTDDADDARRALESAIASRRT